MKQVNNNKSKNKSSNNLFEVNESKFDNKVEVLVCVGTGCYLKGSYDVLDKFKELARQLNLEDYIDLKGTFCLENCDHGISIKVNNEVVSGVTEKNAEYIFKTQIAMKVDPPWV